MGLPRRADTLVIDFLFIFLYLGGTFVSFYVLTGARWARIALSIITLLTTMASLVGLFAFFDSQPFSAVGIAFDLFALASAGILVFSRSREVAMG